MAACPKCISPGLSHTLIDESLPAYSCKTCRGTLLNLVAYRRWRDTTDTPHQPRKGGLEPAPPEDSSDAIKCTKCRRVMTKYRIAAAADNRIDYCVGCEDIWLDDGEWDLIANLVGTDQLAAVLSQAWQYRVRAGRRKHMETARMKDMLGADYERVAEIREWVQAHPSRTEILALVSRRD